MKLSAKLEALPAVLKVAIAKIEHGKEAPDADIERLDALCSKLKNTLGICERAKGTLEGQMALEASGEPGIAPTRHKRSGAREYVEMTSIDEYQKFKKLPPITEDEVLTTDLDELARQLGDV